MQAQFVPNFHELRPVFALNAEQWMQVNGAGCFGCARHAIGVDLAARLISPIQGLECYNNQRDPLRRSGMGRHYDAIQSL